MKSSQQTFAFIKTATCPASSTLLSFRTKKLSPNVITTVEQHLEICEFCNAELPLLAHHGREKSTRRKPPEIPMNLRILAESILCHGAKVVK